MHRLRAEAGARFAIAGANAAMRASSAAGIEAHALFLREAASRRVADTMRALASDDSALALRPRDEALLRSLLTAAAMTQLRRTPITTAKQDKSYWRFWCEWCAVMGTAPLRTDTAANARGDIAE
eukprot:6172837-Pleurochrysis_carterae.AAC.1